GVGQLVDKAFHHECRSQSAHATPPAGRNRAFGSSERHPVRVERTGNGDRALDRVGIDAREASAQQPRHDRGAGDPVFPADRLAAGIQRGDTVAVMSPNIPAMIEAHFAVRMSGRGLTTPTPPSITPAVLLLLGPATAPALMVDPKYPEFPRRAPPE
ncbi:hypothetical protein OY671_011952, partial [Metschnikowia pulcherrima]